MENQTTLGMNRTGIDMSPEDSKELIDYTAKAALAPGEGEIQVRAIAAVRSEMISEADPVGSVPVPGTMKGMASSAMGKLTGKSPEVLIDKLGERLAYERAGVRLYAAFIEKCRSAPGNAFNVPVDQATHFCQQEGQHFQLLAECLRKMGADPTAQTPCADVTGVQSYGFMQVLTDPRTTIAQCTEALLNVELGDNASWNILIKLAQEMGYQEMASQFETALQQEDEHLQTVRLWHEQAVMTDAGVGASA